MPDIDSTLIGFRIEVLFEYTETDGIAYLDWCHGESTSGIGDNSKEECLRPGDCSTT